MTTQEFSETLVTILTKRMTKRLIELAEASIDAGVEEYIEKGYITLNFKGEFDPNEEDKMRQDLLTKGLSYHEFRCIYDTAWSQMHRHLERSGWKEERLEVDGNDQRIVKMPSKLIDEQ